MELIVHLLHIFFVGGLFLYVGIQKTLHPFVYTILFFLGIFVILYHMYKGLKAKQIPWKNLIHILLVGPLLLYIGYNKENTQHVYFDLLLMLGFASIGYHGYSYISKSNLI